MRWLTLRAVVGSRPKLPTAFELERVHYTPPSKNDKRSAQWGSIDLSQLITERPKDNTVTPVAINDFDDSDEGAINPAGILHQIKVHRWLGFVVFNRYPQHSDLVAIQTGTLTPMIVELVRSDLVLTSLKMKARKTDQKPVSGARASDLSTDNAATLFMYRIEGQVTETDDVLRNALKKQGVSYQFNDLMFDTSFCTVAPCNRTSQRHVALIGVDWHPHPIRLD